MTTITDEELATIPMTREVWDALPVREMTRRELAEFGEPPPRLITSLHKEPNGYGLAKVGVVEEPS